MLHYSAAKGDTFVVKQLLKAGACKSNLDRYKFNPYGLALREEKFDTALAILKSGSFDNDDVLRGGAGTYGTLIHLAVAKL